MILGRELRLIGFAGIVSGRIRAIPVLCATTSVASA